MIQFTRFHHLLLSVPVGALETARAFYGGVLGLPEVPGPHPKTTIWYQVADIELHIQEDPAPPEARSKRHPAFEVANVAAAREALERQGQSIEPASVLDGRQRFFIRDPFGNRLELLQMN